jgi:hypothetical protein
MINKIQYLRRLTAVGMPGPSGLNVSPATINNQLSNLNSIPVDPNLVTIDPNINTNINTAPIPGPISGVPPVPLAPVAPPTTLPFNDIADLNEVSNEPLVHTRDNAGNIVLLNDSSTTNQLLTIESISYTVTNTAVNSVIDTQFNYFKFPPRLKNIEVVDEIDLSDSIEDIDLLSTRYTPSLESGRQSGAGRAPILRAGRMIEPAVDDTLIASYPYGYYDTDWRVDSILNMDIVLAGQAQLKPSKFIITPDMIDAGENLFFRIRIDHGMKISGNRPYGDTNTNRFYARLNKITGTTGGFNTVMRTGNYEPAIYTNPAGGFFNSQLASAISDVRSSVNTYKSRLSEYNNALALTGDRTTVEQRFTLTNLKTRVDAAKVVYDNATNRLLTAQAALNNRLAGTNAQATQNDVFRVYEMTYLVDMSTARAYDEYWISTSCDTENNSIGKESTYWQIVTQSKIRTAY